MLIGYSGTLRKGYDIKEMVNLIGRIIDTEDGQRIAIVGLGNLGKAIIHYLQEKKSKLHIVAAFDNNPDKINQSFSDVYCYAIDQLDEIVTAKKITIGIITSPPEVADELAKKLADAGIKGIVNFTPKPLSVEEGVYLEEYDMITSFEKVAYFVKP